jgi:hypothetical protein
MAARFQRLVENRQGKPRAMQHPPKASELQPLLQAPQEASGEDRDARGSGIVAKAAEAV